MHCRITESQLFKKINFKTLASFVKRYYAKAYKMNFIYSIFIVFSENWYSFLKLKQTLLFLDILLFFLEIPRCCESPKANTFRSVLIYSPGGIVFQNRLQICKNVKDSYNLTQYKFLDFPRIPITNLSGLIKFALSHWFYQNWNIKNCSYSSAVYKCSWVL